MANIGVRSATVEPTVNWQSSDTCDRVVRLVRAQYGRVPGKPDVHPLYQVSGSSRWRVNYWEGGRITSSFRVLAQVTGPGLEGAEITRDACRPS